MKHSLRVLKFICTRCVLNSAINVPWFYKIKSWRKDRDSPCKREQRFSARSFALEEIELEDYVSSDLELSQVPGATGEEQFKRRLFQGARTSNNFFVRCFVPGKRSFDNLKIKIDKVSNEKIFNRAELNVLTVCLVSNSSMYSSVSLEIGKPRVKNSLFDLLSRLVSQM